MTLTFDETAPTRASSDQNTGREFSIGAGSVGMRPPALGAISGGVRYQLRLFWLHALGMISSGGIDRVDMEHDEAEGVDDLAVFYSPPGRNHVGRLIDADFFQSKFHVAHNEAIDHKFFTDATRTRTRRPLIARMAETGVQQRVAYPRHRITFLTNWAWDPRDPFRKLIRESGNVDLRLLTSTPRSKLGSIRAALQGATGLDDGRFAEFLESLRFQVPWGAQWQVEERLRDLMDRAGLQVPAPDHECVALEDLGARFLESGRKGWTGTTLRAVLAQEGLFAPPTRRAPVAAVRSFSRLAGLDMPPGAVDVDLTDLFDGRTPRSAAVWSETIPERLAARLGEVAKLEQPVELALDCHLSVAWHLGTLLDAKSGVRVALRQKGLDRGVEVWNPSGRADGQDEWVLAAVRDGGTELAIAVSITHDIAADVERALPDLGLGSARLVSATVRKPGSDAIADGSHAAVLASELVARLRGHAAAGATTRVHFFMAAPVSFAFLLGQRSAVLGPITAYEFDFNASRTYAPGMSSPRPDGHSR